MAIVYLGIGSNLGNKTANCQEAITRLQTIEGIKLEDRSHFYKTAPLGNSEQPDFINGVLKMKISTSPEKLLRILKDIEIDMGREKSELQNQARNIDLDILLYGDEVLDTDKLTVPHPRMHERYFVLHGMNEIAPNVVHPILGKTIQELYEKTVKPETVKSN